MTCVFGHQPCKHRQTREAVGRVSSEDDSAQITGAPGPRGSSLASSRHRADVRSQGCTTTQAPGRRSEVGATASSTATTTGTLPSARHRRSALDGGATARAGGTRSTPAREPVCSFSNVKVLLSGVGDLRTLDTVSRLAGQGDVAVRSVNTTAWWSGRPSASTTTSTRRQERLPVDQVHSLAPGTALVIAGARPPQLAALTPWWGYPPFSEARRARPPPRL
jgi:hypothetical protein